MSYKCFHIVLLAHYVIETLRLEDFFALKHCTSLGPITLTFRGQQSTLRPWDPSRCWSPKKAPSARMQGLLSYHPLDKYFEKYPEWNQVFKKYYSF